MGKSIEVRLSDALYTALWDEAKANGQHLFDYARDKLAKDIETKPVSLRVPPQLAGGRSETVQVAASDAPAKVAEFAERLSRLPDQTPAPADDRISRIEDAVARLTDYVLGSQQPAEPQTAQPIDVDSLVNAQFAEAEANGLTEQEPDINAEVMQHAGVRPLSRRPMPFSPGMSPRHLNGL